MKDIIFRKGKNDLYHKLQFNTEARVIKSYMEGDRDPYDTITTAFYYKCLLCHQKVDRDKVLFKDAFSLLNCGV